ncbi:hypothetical protein G4B88_021417 [Cannabis sativa]|uniref:Mei2-like C-terminal RNA recognition motif domain-containing protein n=1 Tax=Cannabis sativa TaxID=3483 RepID=A0A7J6FFZ1_CANSA|nr:hypothetical protein G4B88_021417 [Cannabis sativa]
MTNSTTTSTTKLNPNAPIFIPTIPFSSSSSDHQQYSNPISSMQWVPKNRAENNDKSIFKNIACGPRNKKLPKHPSTTTTPKSNHSIRNGNGNSNYGPRNNRVLCKPKHNNHSSTGSGGFNVTTLMIRNIPCKYTRKMMLDFMDDYCESENHDQQEKGPNNNKSAFDFLYLPMDFRTHFNKGYAFVNFTNPRAASKFWKAKDNQKWDYFQSKKIRQIAPATIQGKDALVERFAQSKFGCEMEEFLPVSFCPPRDGSHHSLRCHQNNIGHLIRRRT